MEEKKEYINQSLLFYTDRSITSNSLSISTSISYVPSSTQPMSQLFLQFRIHNQKASVNSSVAFGLIEACALLREYEKFEKQLKGFLEKKDDKSTLSFSVKIHQKQLTVTFMTTMEYGMCYRITIGKVDQHYTECDKVFFNHSVFCAIMSVLKNFNRDYASLSVTCLSVIASERMSFAIGTFLTNLNYLTSKMKPVEAEYKEAEPVQPDETLQNSQDFISFYKENKDTIEPDIPDEILTKEESKTKVVTEVKKTAEKDLIELAFENNMINIESVLSSCVHNENPFGSLIDWISSKTEISERSLYGDCPLEERNAICYLMNNILKKTLKAHLLNDASVMPKISPIVFTPSTIGENNITLMYDILSIYFYYNQLSTQIKEKDRSNINNKDQAFFKFKCLFLPFALSYLAKVEQPKELIISEICNRLNLLISKGVFEEYEKNLKSQTGYIVSIKISDIESGVSRIYDLMKNILSKSHVSNRMNEYFDAKLCDRKYDDFIVKEDSQKEQIINDGGNVLVNFCKKALEGNEHYDEIISVVSKIKTSYFDLKEISNINLACFPELVLKAICLWDPSLDPQITNDAKYFALKVEKSSLTYETSMAMLNFVSCSEPSSDNGSNEELNLME